jgi:hypothetical protein
MRSIPNDSSQMYPRIVAKSCSADPRSMMSSVIAIPDGGEDHPNIGLPSAMQRSVLIGRFWPASLVVIGVTSFQIVVGSTGSVGVVRVVSMGPGALPEGGVTARMGSPEPGLGTGARGSRPTGAGAGQSRTKLRAMAPLLLRALGLFNPTVRELTEMQYLFEEPFIVDSSKIANNLGTHPTPIEQALTATLATYRR